MRIPSGTTDKYIYFVAVDATDFVTRETGLSSFTVRRSRNGGADVTYTTPTIVEIDNSTMPGVYALLVDEDTTIGSGDDSEEYCVHITHAGMAPVTRTIELYRPKITEGETVTASSGNANAAVQSIANNAVTAASLASDAGAEIADALLDKTDGVESGLTVRQWLRLGAAVLFGKANGLGTTTANYRDIGDSKNRIVATVDADGNRSAVTRDAT